MNLVIDYRQELRRSVCTLGLIAAIGTVGHGQTDDGDRIETPAWWYTRAQAAATLQKDEPAIVYALLKIAREQQKSGDLNGAHATIVRAMEVSKSCQDTYRKADLFEQIAIAFRETSDRRASLQACRLAIDLSSSRENATTRAWLLESIGSVQAELGEHAESAATFEKAFDAAKRIELLKDAELCQLGCRVAALGHFELAESVVSAISTERDRATVLFRVALAQAARGDFARARKTATAIQKYNSACMTEIVEIQIAREQIEHKDFAQANQTIAGLRTEFLGRFGDYDDVEFAVRLPFGTSTSDMIRREKRISGCPRAFLYVELACAQGGNGDQAGRRESIRLAHEALNDATTPNDDGDKGALAFAKILSGMHPRDKLLGAIVATQVQVGDLAGAKDTAQIVFHPWERAEAWVKIANAEVNNASDRSTAFETALDIAKEIEDADYRRDRCLLIARSAAALGNVDAGLSASAVAKRAFRHPPNPDTAGRFQVADLCEIALIELKLGSPIAHADTIKLASEFAMATPRNTQDRVQAFAILAKNQTRAGDRNGYRRSLKECSASADSIHDQEVRKTALLDIVNAAAESDDPDSAIQFLARADKATASETFYPKEAIIRSLARAGRFSEAHAHADRLKGAFSTPLTVFSEIGEMEAASGDLKGLQEWVDSMSDPDKIIEVCIGAARGTAKRQEAEKKRERN